MQFQDEENSLNCYEEEMESEDDLNQKTPIHFMKNNNLIYCGFYEKSTNTFYKIKKIESKKFSIIPNLQELKIKYLSNEFHHSKLLIYNLLDNPPTLIKIKSKINEDKLDIILHFTYSPIHRKKPSYYNNISLYLQQNYNLENNLLCFNCPYKTLYIPQCSNEDLVQINNHLFYSEKKTRILYENELNILSFDDYKIKIKELKEKINKDCKNNFNELYTSYANISENIDKREFETIFSIYKNYKSDFKIEKNIQEKKTDKNKNEIYVMKRIVITPYYVRIKKESLHPSSRFLRLYYKNNNFIKVEFQDEKESQLFSHFGYKHNKSKYSGYGHLYYKVFNEGFNLCGKNYLFFFSPTNCMRANCIWLLEEKEHKEKLSFYYHDLGVYSAMADQSIKFSKSISRVGQNFTSTVAFYHKNKNISFDCQVINDLIAPNGELYNDGCGMISVDLMKDICNELNKGKYSSAIQIRYKGAKGVLVVNHKINGRKIILTKSMIKYNVNNSENLEICRFSRYSTGFLNLQIIILLVINGVKSNKIFNIVKKEMMNYRNYKIVKNSKKIPVENNDINKILNTISKQDENLILHKDYMSKIARSAYIYNRLAGISKKYRFHLKNCCFLFGVCDFFGILKKDQIFAQIHKENGNKKIIQGEVLITRNPCLSSYDIHKVQAVNNSRISKYFSEFYENIIIFPSKGKMPLPSKISGGDLDGDIYWICWERAFVKQFKEKDYAFKPYMLKNKEELTDENFYTLDENDEKVKTTTINITIHDFNKKSIIEKSTIKNDILNSLNNNINMDEINKKIKDLCLNYYIFYQKNYKLPEVSKNHLYLIYNIFKDKIYIDGRDNNSLEKFAFYHSIEVDFQKTGETSEFDFNEKNIPQFLKKTEQYRLSNNLIKLKDIYDEYNKIIKSTNKKSENDNLESSEDNLSTIGSINYSLEKEYDRYEINKIIDKNYTFYDFFVENGIYMKNEIERKNLKLFEKQKLIHKKNTSSLIFLLYQLISFYPAMQDSFLNSIYLMTKEFFYDNNLKQKKFIFSEKLFYNINLLKEIIKQILIINKKYENEIKYIMKDNSISIEIELIYFNEYIEPKKEVYKHDVEDYRKNLFECVNLVQKNSLKEIENIKNKYDIKYEDIKNILFIISFWISNENLNICLEGINNYNYELNLYDILFEEKRIDNVKNFINKMAEKTTLLEIINFFYDNIRCFSLYYCFCDYFQNKK